MYLSIARGESVHQLQTGNVFHYLIYGRVPERPKGTDCKSVAFQLRWFESTLFHQKNLSVFTGRFFLYDLVFLRKSGLLFFGKVGYGAVKGNVSFTGSFGNLIGSTCAVACGKAALYACCHISVNNNMSVFRFQPVKKHIR